MRYLAGFYSSSHSNRGSRDSGSRDSAGSGSSRSDSDSDSRGITRGRGGVRYVLPRDKVLFLPQDSYCFEVRGCETNDVHYSY